MPKGKRKKMYGRRTADAERKARSRPTAIETVESALHAISPHSDSITKPNKTANFRVPAWKHRKKLGLKTYGAVKKAYQRSRLSHSRNSQHHQHIIRDNSFNQANLSIEEKKFENHMMNLTWQHCEICKMATLSTTNKQCRKRCVHFSHLNDMDPGPVPHELACLTYLEQQLIARVHPVVCLYRIKGNQIGYSGHVINFPQDIKEFAKKLPNLVTEVPCIVAVRVGGENPNDYMDFHVRAKKVRDALMWLKENNPFYSDIIVSEENLSLLPEDGNVLNLLHLIDDMTLSDDDDPTCQVETTNVPMTRQPHQDHQVMAVLDWPTMEKRPVDEFNSPGYIAQAFPTLFPTGKADLGNNRTHKVSPVDYFKHLIQYHDMRFANDPRFRFFALNSTMRWTALTSGNLFVRHNEELRGKTLQELQEIIASRPHFVKKIMCYGSKLKGTKAYWRARLAELLEMEKQLGLPTVFMTLSAADLQWPDVMRLMNPSLSDHEISELSDQDRRELLAENPLVSAMFFYERTEFFLDQILKLKFGVVDHWRRYEWQHRGSPHIHMLLWLDQAPDVSSISEMDAEEREEVVRYFDYLICTMNPGLNQPPATTHPCRKHLHEVENREEDLSELINKVQRHTKCSTNYCLRKNKKTGQVECRYHFPFPLCDETQLVQNEKGQYELMTKRNDPLVNKYNPWVLQLWRANIDITPVLSKDAFLNYIAKYASKAEVKSKTMNEVFDETTKKMETDTPARKAIQKVLIQTCAERDYSSQEVLHLATGKKLFSSSRAFVKINFSQSEWVAIGNDPDDLDICPENGGEEHDVPTLNEETRNLSFIDKYKLRPRNLDTVCLWDCASLYTPKRRGPWTKRRKPAVVCVLPRRLLTTNQTMNEEYYRQKVLLHIPWRCESDVKGDFETWKEVYDSWSLQNEAPTNNPTNEEDDWEEIPCSNDVIPLEEWMVISRKGPENEVDSVEPGFRDIDLLYDWGAASQLYLDPPLLRNYLQHLKDNQSTPTVEYVAPEVTLTASQLEVMNVLEHQIAAAKTITQPKVQLLIVQGKAGCGKSTLIKKMTAHLTEELGSNSFLLLAPTGSAALNVNGNTLHSALNIPIKQSMFKPLEGAAARNFLEVMASVKFLIIDEYSMIGLHLLSMVEQRCSEAKPDSHLIFGGINIYLIGDICQLPPVLAKPIYYLHPTNDLEKHGKFTFSHFQHAIELGESMRQTDTALRNALDEIAQGICTEQSYCMFKSRFKRHLTNEELNEFEDAVHIFTTRAATRQHNGKKLLSLHSPIARVPAKHNNATAKKGTSDQACGLESILYLSKGARIVLRANLWVQGGLVNGSQGTLVDIVYNVGEKSPHDLPVAILVRFDNFKGQTLPGGELPIPPLVRTWTSGRVNCTREQIPVSLAWGCTVHQSQGQTYDKVVVDIGPQEFQTGLSYVALSRAKTVEGMVIHPEFPRMRLDSLQHKKSLKNKLIAVKKIKSMARKNTKTPLDSPPPCQSAMPNPCPACPPPPNPTTEIVAVKEGAALVAIMPGDGNCLFHAILHQLGDSQPGHDGHLNQVQKLRGDVVKYIRDQLQKPGNELWLLQLKDSIAAQPNLYTSSSSSDNIEQFLSNLEGGKEWGGTETLVSVAALKNINIETYFEATDNCSVHLTTPENGNGNKLIALVYRGRCHYDSLLQLL